MTSTAVRVAAAHPSIVSGGVAEAMASARLDAFHLRFADPESASMRAVRS